MPGWNNHNVSMGIPQTKGLHIHRGFNEVIPIFEERNYTISGITRNNAGAALGLCTVELFNTETDIKEQITISDASGNYSFIVDKTKSWYMIAYLTGAPDIAGTTVNTVVGL